MPFTPEQQAASLASQSSMTKLQRLTFENENIDTLRLVSDKQDLTESDGTIFNRFAFEVTAPEKTSENPPQLSITIGIVDDRVMAALRALRGIRGKIVITYDEVQADDPSKLIYGPAKFYFQDLKTNGNTKAKITATFLKGALNNSYPSGRITPANAQSE